MAEKEKILDKKMMFQIGCGVLLYLLLRRADHKVKTENKPVDVKGNDNEVTKGVKVEVHNPAIIRIDPNIGVSRHFKNKEYFGGRTEVPKEHYSNWNVLSNLLTTYRLLFKAPIIISKGYSSYPDAKGAVIKPQNGNVDGLWNSIMMFMETNRKVAKSVTRLASGLIEVKI